MCVKGGVERPQSEIGIMATDDEAYKAFGDLFGPIIKDLHPKFDFRYSYKFEELDQIILSEKIAEIQNAVDKVKNFKITAKRNFKGIPFTTLMTKEAKL